MLNTYAFILGRNPALSFAEIVSVFKREEKSIETIGVSEEVVVVKTNKEIDAKSVIGELGGTIKIAKIVSMLELEKSEEQLLKLFSEENLLTHFFERRKGKVHFGVSLYFLDTQSEFITKYKKLLENINSIIKKNLQETNQSSGFVRIKERYLSSVSVVKNSLLDKGAEILLIFSQNKLYVGKTAAVQEFEDYSRRDYGRPSRDPRSGMLPPKLAKIMLNLATKNKDSAIADPFCGSGTIITEALLLGYKEICGSDVSIKAVTSTIENTKWVESRYLDKAKGSNIKIFQSDVINLSQQIAPHSIDAIATEAYLGPPFTRYPSELEVKQVIGELSSLYKKSFYEFAKILKDKGNVVIAFPIFKSNEGYKWIDIINDLRSAGFHLQKYLSSDIAQKFPLFYSKRSTFIYGRGDEFIKREILVFSYETIK